MVGPTAMMKRKINNKSKRMLKKKVYSKFFNCLFVILQHYTEGEGDSDNGEEPDWEGVFDDDEDTSGV